MEIANLIIDEKAMRLMAFFKVFILALALFAPSMITLRTPTVEAQPPGPQRGPRAPGLEIKFYWDGSEMYDALVAGEVEYFDMLTPGQFEDAKTRPEITTYLETTYTVQGEAMMSDYYMPSFPDWRNPLNDVNFRKAVMHLVDKDWIVETVYQGLAERIDVPIAAPSRGWMNTSLIGPNYPYPYSPAQAIQYLEDPAAYGSAENGWYDYDNDTIRNYPLDWWGVEGEIGVRDEPNTHPLQYWIIDDRYGDPWPLRYEYAHAIAEELRALGIPVDEHVAPLCLIDDQAWAAYDFHIASDAWSVGRFPTYLYSWFHSDNWMRGYKGPNAYTGGDDEPWAAEIDAAVEDIIYATNLTDARQSGLHAQSLLIEKYALGMIPILSQKRCHASRNLLGIAESSEGTVKYFEGMVKSYGGGLFNWASEMNAYRADDPTKPIRVATQSPRDINTIHAIWSNGYTIMQRTWEPLIVLNPSDPMYEMPCAARDWETSAWHDPEDDADKTVTRWWLKPGVTFVEPETGDVLKTFNNTFQMFSSWYIYQTPDAWWHDDFEDIHHIRVNYTNQYYMEYYWDTMSWTAYLKAPGSSNLGMYPPAYKQYPLVENPDNPGTAGPAVRTYVEGVNMTTPGGLGLPVQAPHAPVEIVSIVEAGVGALTPSDVSGDNDYEILEGDIHIYKNITDGTAITVTYWARGDARGTTPGNLRWEEIFVGCGKWYMTSFDIVEGITFKANRHHHWTTPPMGETDWCWYWIEGSKPRDGYYQITIFDVTLATSIYGCQGRLVPDAYWDPAMDLASSADGLPGIIDIYDVSIITSQYGTYFWTLPGP